MTSLRLALALLVGDREEATGWIVSLLESGGYAVLRERTGRHGLERARAAQPDVIIVDADLQDGTGVALSALLTHEPRISSNTPIFLSHAGHATRQQRLAALRAGAWDCLAPPHDGEAILLKIGTYVRAKLDADRARAEGLLDLPTGLYNRQGLARCARELGSLAFRQHGALACVALVLDSEPGPAGTVTDERTALQCAAALKSAARTSDVVGRLGPAEFVVLAPRADASCARRLAERLVGILQASAAAAAEPGARPLSSLQVRCGYEAVANMCYSPLEPVELLVRASAAVRTGKANPGEQIPRFEPGPSAPAT